MPCPETLRPAGLLEHFHIARHFLAFDSCVVVGAKYAADGRKLTKELVFAALKPVIEEHLALGVRIVGEDTKQPAFARLQRVDLSCVVRFSEDEADLERVIEKELATRFDTKAEDLPLWRLRVLEDGMVIFAFHHAIADGLGGVVFHRSFLAALQTLDGHSDYIGVVDIPKTTSLAPPIEAAANVRPSILKCITTIVGLFLPASWTPGYTSWTGKPVPAAVPELDPRVKLFTFTGAEMAAFTKVCRAHKATVTSAFYVLGVTTLSRVLPASQFTTLTVTVPITLRNTGNISSDAMGDFSPGQVSHPAMNATFEWAAAAEFATELQHERSVCGQNIGLLGLLSGDFIPFFNGKLGKKRAGSLEISNTGRVTFADGRWSVQDMMFAQCNAVVGDALKLCVAGHGDGSGAVTCALSWTESAVDTMLAETFANNFVAGFRALLAV